MESGNGRLYHASPRPELGGTLLVRSAVADALHCRFAWDEGPEAPPTAFWWRGSWHALAEPAYAPEDPPS